MSKNEFKVLFLDLDGTLLSSHLELTQETQDAVAACTAAGIEVVIATARPPRSTRRYHEALGLSTPSIHYNGALIYDFHAEQVIQHRPIPGGEARLLYQRVLEIDPTAIVSLEVTDTWYLNRQSSLLITQTEREGFRPDYVGDLDACFEEPVTKVLMTLPGADMGEAWRILKRDFGERLSLTKSEEGVLQVMNGGVTKGAAIGFLLDQMGYAREHAAAIGDAPNDIPMFEAVGLSVAVADAYPETKAAADCVTGSNNDNGAAAAIWRFIVP